MKRVKAYTLMEVTIAMLLAGIVIMITYTVYAIVVRTYSAYNQKNAEVAEQLRLDELLKKDFDKATVIFRTDSGLRCNTPNGNIVYTIAPEYIVRNYGVTDSFKVDLLQASFFFENIEIAPIQDSTIIDGMELDVSFRNNINRNHYSKRYSAAELLKLNNYAVN